MRSGDKAKTAIPHVQSGKKVVNIHIKSITDMLKKSAVATHNIQAEKNVQRSRMEEKNTTPLQCYTRPSLPNALIDYRDKPSSWKDLQNMLKPDYLLINREIKAFNDRTVICCITNRLMHDPVRSVHFDDDLVLEREAIILHTAQNKNMDYITAIKFLKLKKASDINSKINGLLGRNPSLASIQYLPEELIKTMGAACARGDVDGIRRLYLNNRRLLLAPDPKSNLLPLNHAIKNDNSLSVIIELLENHQKGLALASLWYPDVSGQIPLENALRYGSSTMTLLNIMAWMGDSLNSFELSRPLPKELRQANLDILLLACILQGNLAWTQKVLSWGANIDAQLEVDTTLLKSMMALGDLSIRAALLDTDGIGIKQQKEESHTIDTCLKGQASPLRVKEEAEASIAIRSVLNTLRDCRISTFSSLHGNVSHSNDELQEQQSLQQLQQQQEQLEQESKLESKLKNKRQKERRARQKEVKNKGKIEPCRLFKISKDNMEKETAFLKAVADGNQPLAESLLKKAPAFADIQGSATDLLGFESRLTNITGYQCAFLLGNMQMSGMIMTYMTPEQASLQYKELGDTTDILDRKRDRDFSIYSRALGMQR